jgi:taurine dioxygenase
LTQRRHCPVKPGDDGISAREEAMDAGTRTKVEVVPLTKHIGAEIRGIDLRDTLDAETILHIRRAWLDHLVLVFRGQRFSQEALVRVTGCFGEIGPLSRPPKYFPKGYAKLLPNVMLISNIRENGEIIGALPDGEMHFHHDMIHGELPHNGTLLYAMEIPSHGGDTLFASGYAAYDTLDPKVRQRLEGRKALNHYNYGSTIRGDTKNAVEAFGEAMHPVFRTHDETGRKAIYVDRLMTMKIVDMAHDESDELLNAVFDHSEREEFVYRHVWRVGDLLIWDNRCSAHARDDFPSDQRRLLWRTTVKGTVRPY